MNTLPDTHVREASHCQSPVTIWQTLLTRLLDQHYGLTLNDTPFADERVIGERMLMLQWWADYLDANRMAAITPFDYAKINSSFR